MKLARSRTSNFQVSFQRKLALKLVKSVPGYKLPRIIGLLKNEMQYSEVTPDKFDLALIAEADRENSKDASAISLEDLARKLEIEL